METCIGLPLRTIEECIRHDIQDLIRPSTEALNDELGSRMLHRSSIMFEAVVDFVTFLGWKISMQS